jgi:hypothetical protein
MQYDEFKKIIEVKEKLIKRSSQLHGLNVNLLDYDEEYHKIIKIFMISTFGEIGTDWIEWYLYERPSFSGTIHKAWDENGKEICFDVPSLWETVKEYLNDK